MHFSESSILLNFFITVSRFHSILKYLKRQLSDIILHATPLQLDALTLLSRTYNQNDFKKTSVFGLLTAFNFLIITIEMIDFFECKNFRFLNIILLKQGRVLLLGSFTVTILCLRSHFSAFLNCLFHFILAKNSNKLSYTV